MKDLIKKLEAAERGRRWLDHEIFIALNPGIRKDINFDEVNGNHYTTSIDAALTLVPEGSGYQILRWLGDVETSAQVTTEQICVGAVSKTAPIAICIAALKAMGRETTKGLNDG